MVFSVIAALGNPGKEYVATRHNAGWIILDALANKAGAEWKGCDSAQSYRQSSSLIFGSALPHCGHVGQAGSEVGGGEAGDRQRLLRDEWGVNADVWSVTSWNELRRDGLETDRHNMLHPTGTPRIA